MSVPFRQACVVQGKEASIGEGNSGRRKMLASNGVGTMASSFLGGSARAKLKEIAPPCFSGLALMHVPVSRQQETPPAFTD